MIRIVANTTYFDPLPNEREPEEATFQKEFTDKELRRTNPKRYDERTDWTQLNNEKGHDSDVANRYSSIPISVYFFKIEDLCTFPTRKKLKSVRNMISHASQNVKAMLYDYVQEQLQSLEWQRNHITKQSNVSSIDIAIRYFVLQKLFE